MGVAESPTTQQMVGNIQTAQVCHLHTDSVYDNASIPNALCGKDFTGLIVHNTSTLEMTLMTLCILSSEYGGGGVNIANSQRDPRRIGNG